MVRGGGGGGRGARTGPVLLVSLGIEATVATEREREGRRMDYYLMATGQDR